MILAPIGHWLVHKCTCRNLGMPRQKDFHRAKSRYGTPGTFVSNKNNLFLAHRMRQFSECFYNSIVVVWVQECHCAIISTDSQDPTATERACVELGQGQLSKRTRAAILMAYRQSDLVHGRVRIVVCDFNDFAIICHGDKTRPVQRPRDVNQAQPVETRLKSNGQNKRGQAGAYITTHRRVHLCLRGNIKNVN